MAQRIVVYMESITYQFHIVIIIAAAPVDRLRHAGTPSQASAMLRRPTLTLHNLGECSSTAEQIALHLVQAMLKLG